MHFEDRFFKLYPTAAGWATPARAARYGGGLLRRGVLELGYQAFDGGLGVAEDHAGELSRKNSGLSMPAKPLAMERLRMKQVRALSASMIGMP